MKHSKSTSSERTQQADRRASARLASKEKVVLHLEAGVLPGRAENLSQGGILMYAEGDLKVTVELQRDGVMQSVQGRVVRLQSMRGKTTGLAIEFDTELEED